MAKKETPQKNKGGRPKLYKEEYIEQVYKLCKLGSTDKDIADFFNVTETTINNWKDSEPKFFESLKRGKDAFDTIKVEGALKHRAIGYEHNETKVFCQDGQIITHEVVKHYPPDTGAAAFWLKNRDPERWRDKQEIDHTTKGDKINLTPMQFVKTNAKD